MATKTISWNTGSGNITLTYQGQGNGTITVASDANDIGSTRSQVIEVQTLDGAITQNLTVNQAACPFPVGEVRNYSYNGSYQTVELPAGQYKFQVWGAQGGTCYDGYSGGKGGYSEGVITLSSKTTVRVYVGGQGTYNAGGFNGGGSTTGSSSYDSDNTSGRSSMGGGGGATDIRLSDGALLSRMIVAGGGSGGAYCYKEVTSQSTETVTDYYLYSSVKTFDYDGVWWHYILKDESMSAGTYSLNKNGQVGIVYIMQYDGIDNCWGGAIDEASSSTTSFTVDGSYEYVAILVRYDTELTSFSVTITHTETTTQTDTDYDYQTGYAGGGTNGAGYSSSYYGKQNSAGSGGSFGQGANQTTSGYRYCSGAGGGGWYGGGGGSYSDYDMSYIYYMGGGSGWVNISANSSYRPSGYTGLELDSGKTIAGNTTMPSTSGSTETGHSGNGYARITRLDPKYAVPLTFKALEAGTIGWKCNNSSYARTIEYSKNGGSWTSLTSTTSGVTISVAAGDEIQFRGANTYYGYSSYYNCFTATCRFKAYGNIMSLFDKTGFIGETMFTSNYALQYLFYNNTKLTDASGLMLPATTLTAYCYQYMFYGCSAMTAGPETLPATTLQSYCYQYMFQNCSSLNYIKALFTTSPSNSYTQNWVSGVAATGTFVKHTNASWTTTGTNACPSGWTVERASS